MASLGIHHPLIVTHQVASADQAMLRLALRRAFVPNREAVHPFGRSPAVTLSSRLFKQQLLMLRFIISALDRPSPISLLSEPRAQRLDTFAILPHRAAIPSVMGVVVPRW